MSMVPTAGWKTVPAYSIAKDEPDYYLSMGLTAEAVAKEYNVSREEQDEFSYQSHQKAINAIQNGHFKNGILPMNVEEVYVDEKGKKQKKNFVVDTDEGPRTRHEHGSTGQIEACICSRRHGYRGELFANQ